MALWNSFGDIQPSRLVSKSWNACDVVKSFSFKNISENFRIISTLGSLSTSASTICLPIGPFSTLPKFFSCYYKWSWYSRKFYFDDVICWTERITERMNIVPSNMESMSTIISFCKFRNSRSNSSCVLFLYNFSIMCANKKKNPLIASHNREFANVIWFPAQGPCQRIDFENYWIVRSL